MKFIEDDKLIQITQELSDVVYGTRVINGRVECFSCKRTGGDKKYAHDLTEKYLHEIEHCDAIVKKTMGSPISSYSSPRDKSFSDLQSCIRKGRSTSVGSTSDLSTSPLGDFHESVTQRLLTDLILTLNSSFPDYDYSFVRPDHFVRVTSVKSAMNRTNEKMSEFLVSGKGPEFLNDLWSAIDDVIMLKDCEIYSYTPDDTSDEFLSALTGDEQPHSPGVLWSLNYFFVNKTLKRIVFFTCVSSLKSDGSDKYIQNYEEGNHAEIQFIWEADAPITTS